MNLKRCWLIFFILIFLPCLKAAPTKSKPKMEKIYLMTIGEVDEKLLKPILSELEKRFPYAFEIIKSEMKLPREAYSFRRTQYWSSGILKAAKDKGLPKDAKRVLVIVAVDLYVPHLNFVFGEAELNGQTAIISLYRLRPEYYGQKPDSSLFIARILKEAVHELGHTFGLKHCPDPLCIMHFSNSISDTDKKKPDFCSKCLPKLKEQFPSEKRI